MRAGRAAQRKSGRGDVRGRGGPDPIGQVGGASSGGSEALPVKSIKPQAVVPQDFAL